MPCHFNFDFLILNAGDAKKKNYSYNSIQIKLQDWNKTLRTNSSCFLMYINLFSFSNVLNMLNKFNSCSGPQSVWFTEP